MSFLRSLNFFFCLGALNCFFSQTALSEDTGDFDDVEVRVIREKYFQKKFRPELALDINFLMNQAFVYSFLPGGRLGLHFTETLGVFGEGAAGLTMNKSSCERLGTDFQIEPKVQALSFFYGGGLSYTPVYGKYQLSDGDVIYFDWFMFASGGMTQLTERRGQCMPESDGTEESEVVPGVTVSVGTGQRYFLTQSISLNWNFRYMLLGEDFGSLVGEGSSNFVLSLGASYFFF